MSEANEDPKKPSEDEKKTSDELSNKDLEQVTGGAVSAYLIIDGATGESTTTSEHRVASAPLPPITSSLIAPK